MLISKGTSAALLRVAVVFVLALSHVACAAPTPTTIMLPMPDGVKLATDIYLPSDDGSWPVILARSTYGRNGGEAASLNRKGYVLVIQDVRGMNASEGEKYVFHPDGWRPELHDGADTVAWIKQQKWCNGKIGTFGGSALGITQQLLAPATKEIAAQFIEVAPSNMFAETAYRGGVWGKSLLESWLAAIGQPHLIPVYKSHPRYDEFWTWYNYAAKAPDMTSPAMFVGGWFDIFNQGEIDSFLTREQNGGPGCKGKNYLIMKWSPHGADTTPDYKHNENRFDLKISQLRDKFFKANLQGDAHALDGVAKVHYYVMGDDAPGAPGNEWRTAESWPPYATKETALHLQQDGSLGAAAGPDGARAFTFDPAKPVMTVGGQNLVLPAGPYDQRSVSGREDVLKYVTAPLEKPLEITGRVKLRLSVSSDAPDTDFTAKLVDVFPDGREILMLDNVRRVKSRLGLDQAAPLLTGPSEIVEIEIDLWSIAWIFNTGHRIGVQVSSSNFPRFEVNPNTGEDFPPADGAGMRVAHNQVHAGAHDSVLLLPVRE